jgi:hypothetical protein
MAGLTSPRSVQGTDFSQVAAGAPETDAAALLCLPVPFGSIRRFGIAEYRGIRTLRHTYVRSIRGPWLLYDNNSDPYQMRNLCNRPEERTEQRELNKILDKKLRIAGDDFLRSEQYIESAHLKHYRDVNVRIGQQTSPWGDWEATLAR